MNDYKIFEIRDDKYKFIILPYGDINIFDYMLEISSRFKLKENKIKPCDLLIDNILKTGNNQDRFIKATFNGSEFTDFIIVKVEKKNNFLRNFTSSFLKENQSILKNSILNSIQIKMITKGLVI